MNESMISRLRGIAMFEAMSDEALTALIALMRPVQFAPGQTIIHEGDTADCFYVILEGRVRFLTQHFKGQEIELGQAGSGESFGEIAMFTGEKRAARVSAMEPTSTLAIAYSAFHDFLLAHPQAAIDIMKLLANRLNRTGALLREAGRTDANAIDDARQTLGNRISDWVAQIMGSWRFIFILTAVIIGWIVWNSIADTHNAAHPNEPWLVFDGFPFILLNLGMSLIAVFSAPIIMMSQNRAADKDRLVAEIDHQVNVKSETQIGLLVQRLDNLEKSLMHRLDGKAR